MDSKALLSEQQCDSLNRAISQEIAAQKERVGVDFLNIDAIELKQQQAGGYVYRLVLSQPINAHADQVLTFHIRRPQEKINAIVMVCDDAGLVVLTTRPLPEDATLIKYSFDPSFILVALRSFLEAQQSGASDIARSVSRKDLPLPSEGGVPPMPVRLDSDTLLDEHQAASAARMLTDSVHLLWGPPGTGKTHTVGCAAKEALLKGERILIVSTSNAAVDAVCKSIVQHLPKARRRDLFRAGHSLDPKVMRLTAAGRMAQDHPELGSQIQETREHIKRIINQKTGEETQLRDLATAKKLQEKLNSFEESAEMVERKLSQYASIVACTLAKLVLDPTIGSRSFEMVVIDEASMVSIPFALAAATVAKSRLTYAGDCQQLPPICQSPYAPATEWFGRNIYRWFDYESAMMDGHMPPQASFLANQYRMTPTIGTLVSDLSYHGKLKTARSGFDKDFQGAKPILIPMNDCFPATYYSVSEKSYFHPGIIPIVHGLANCFSEGDVLLLTPFRPQRSLLAAVGVDAEICNSQLRITASTIHRAQGSECRAVIVDLTAHDPTSLVSFFRDPQSEKLLNVALSRARDELIVIGNTRVVAELADKSRFWQLLHERVGRDLEIMEIEEVCDDLKRYKGAADIPRGGGSRSETAFYSHGDDGGAVDGFARIIAEATASRKLVVTPTGLEVELSGDAVVRRDRRGDLPRLLVVGGKLYLPYQSEWMAVESPNACRTLWRIGFAHLADDEANPEQAARFFCPECDTGNLILMNFKGEGWYLSCHNRQAHQCYYRRRLSLHDAKLKVRFTNMRCPDRHPLTVRTSKGGRMFLACENYPAHEYTESLNILAGT